MVFGQTPFETPRVTEYGPPLVNCTWGFCDAEDVPFIYTTVDGTKVQVQLVTLPVERSENVTVVFFGGVKLSAEKSATVFASIVTFLTVGAFPTQPVGFV